MRADEGKVGDLLVSCMSCNNQIAPPELELEHLLLVVDDQKNCGSGKMMTDDRRERMMVQRRSWEGQA